MQIRKIDDRPGAYTDGERDEQDQKSKDLIIQVRLQKPTVPMVTIKSNVASHIVAS